MKGFTLVELVIVIAIVIVLSVVSVPIYNNYVEKAMMAEGYAFLGTVLTAQKAYYTEYGYFARSDSQNITNTTLGISVKGNKYFSIWFSANNYNSPGPSIEMEVQKPSNLITNGKSYIYLKYNLTTGSTFIES